MPKKIVIEAENLSFSYGAAEIFKNVDFKLYQGDFAALIGSNGSGKSTLLKIILQELFPKTGKLQLWQKDILHLKHWGNLAYVPQNGLVMHQNFPASVKEIVQSGLYKHRKKQRLSRSERKNIVEEALTKVHLQDYSKRLISQLSGGQLQRVLLARSLVQNAKLMLLDEPTMGIDQATIDLFYQILSDLTQNQGLTILMVTHDIQTCYPFVNRTFCLEKGSLIELDKNILKHELEHKHLHPQEKEQNTSFSSCCANCTAEPQNIKEGN